MIPKQVYLNDEGQVQLREGLRIFAGAVKSTLGPAGRTVLLESDRVVGGFMATKDGVTVARSLRFENPIHDLVALMLLQASQRTADTAGDGTTTAVVLTEAIVNAFDKYAKDSNLSVVEITRGIQSICNEMVVELDKASIPMDNEMIEHVATISANNDPVVGKIIADVFREVELVTVENSTTSEIKTEIIRGIKIDKGFTSRYFITDVRKSECVLDNPVILLCDREIKDLRSILEVGTYCTENGVPLLIIGTLSEEALATMNANVATGKIKAAVVQPPSTGYLKGEKMEDLAYVLGAKYFSAETGDNLERIVVGDLGRARKVTITSSMTIIEPNLNSEQDMKDRIIELKEAKKSVNEKDSKDIDSRIEAIESSFGVIYVGAPTSIEQKELKDRVDDAVCAVRAAKEEGILPGGGVGLIESITSIPNSIAKDSISFRIMSEASVSPILQMMKNAGINEDDFSFVPKSGRGLNIKTGEFCDMVKAGVIDPTKVVKSALVNAVSVAITILSTSCIITNTRETFVQK